MPVIRACLGGILLGVLVLQGWTQYLAHHYGYHALLGAPWWQGQGFWRRYALYPPWEGLRWSWQWGTLHGQRALLLGLLVGVTLVGVWVWMTVRRRRRQPPPMTGHGTTQWATLRDVKKAGLL
jgi:hypothetical protein